MKNSNIAYALVVLVVIGSHGLSWGQAINRRLNEEAVSGNDQFPFSIKIVAAVSLRFQQKATAYLQWDGPENRGVDYLVRYKTAGSATVWEELKTFAQEIVIENLALDTEYEWEVKSVADNEVFRSGPQLLSTFAQTEPIAVSALLFNQLSSWFAASEHPLSFCDILEEAAVHPFEKLAFLQAYAFANQPLQQQPNHSDLRNWYPLSMRETDCVGWITANDARERNHCKVITTTWQSPTSTGSPDWAASSTQHGSVPTLVELTATNHTQHAALKQDGKGGRADYSLANLSEKQVTYPVETAFVRDQYLLACLDRSGHRSRQGSEEKDQRELILDYDYHAQLRIKAEQKNCVFERGAAAQAEAAALVIAVNEYTGKISTLAAQHSFVGHSCEAGWEPRKWITAPDLSQSLQSHFLTGTKIAEGQRLIRPTKLPGQRQWLAFEDTLSHQLYATVGKEKAEPEYAAELLLNGTDTLRLLPNEPLTVILFAGRYLRTKGFGCYQAEASVNSGFSLTGTLHRPSTRYANKEQQWPSSATATDNKMIASPSLAARNTTLKLYPTTATTQVTITLPGFTRKEAILRIYDTQGRAIYQQELASQQGQPEQLIIDLSNWQAGTYWVELQADGKTDTLPLIKV